MIKGLINFKDFFADYSDNYAIIGGCACDLLFDNAGLDFRATKDVDLVLIAEALSPEFINKFWDYVKEANYKHMNKSANKPEFYRFNQPENKNFPIMIELFSRKLDSISVPPDMHLTPVPSDNDLSSLSAILLNESYYQLLVKGKIKIEGISLIDVPQLIAFKAKAWLDLSEKKSKGIHVNSKDIKKHKNDVIRLYRLLNIDTRLIVPKEVYIDFQEFIEKAFTSEIDPKQLNVNVPLDLIISQLRKLFIY